MTSLLLTKFDMVPERLSLKRLFEKHLAEVALLVFSRRIFLTQLFFCILFPEKKIEMKEEFIKNVFLAPQVL